MPVSDETAAPTQSSLINISLPSQFAEGWVLRCSCWGAPPCCDPQRTCHFACSLPSEPGRPATNKTIYSRKWPEIALAQPGWPWGLCYVLEVGAGSALSFLPCNTALGKYRTHNVHAWMEIKSSASQRLVQLLFDVQSLGLLVSHLYKSLSLCPWLPTAPPVACLHRSILNDSRNFT